jgi:hypothetical protein
VSIGKSSDNQIEDESKENGWSSFAKIIDKAVFVVYLVIFIIWTIRLAYCSN